MIGIDVQSLRTHLEEAIQWRRALHACPQPSWLEFYATAFIAEKLAAWGYNLQLGRDIIATDKQLLLPDEERLQQEYDRALQAGANQVYLEPSRGGFTGVVATLKGAAPGPTVGFRFDIDSNEVTEAEDMSHRPSREGFRSRHAGYAHACGHDVHGATGLLLAKYFAGNRDKICGTIKLIFQPNEENLSGAAAMIAKGVADDLDYLFSGHVGLSLKKTGQISFDIRDFMALSRFEVSFAGRPTHAALRPDQGKNAMLGACAAVSNLYSIARHGLGATRINVGFLQAGTAWNVIPDNAYFRMETRGVSNELNNYMVDKAREVIAGAAQMYGLTYEMKPAAEAIVAENSPELVQLAVKVAGELPSVTEIVPVVSFNASEDVTLFVDKVRQRGGQALVAMFGTPVHGGHHNSTFDVDETVIANAAEFFAAMYQAVTSK